MNSFASFFVSIWFSSIYWYSWWYYSTKTKNGRYQAEQSVIIKKTLDRIGIGMGNREDENEIMRKITLHSFRRDIKTTIADLGYSDYSDWFIGHSGSTYWRKNIREGRNISKDWTISNFSQCPAIKNTRRRFRDKDRRITRH